jgi:hypothetical protein
MGHCAHLATPPPHKIARFIATCPTFVAIAVDAELGLLAEVKITLLRTARRWLIDNDGHFSIARTCGGCLSSA